MHEVDSAAGFSDFNNPDMIHDARDFQHAANKIGYTFNWFYIDNQHIGYFNSGNEPGPRQGHHRPTARCAGASSSGRASTPT